VGSIQNFKWVQRYHSPLDVLAPTTFPAPPDKTIMQHWEIHFIRLKKHNKKQKQTLGYGSSLELGLTCDALVWSISRAPCPQIMQSVL